LASRQPAIHISASLSLSLSLSSSMSRPLLAAVRLQTSIPPSYVAWDCYHPLRTDYNTPHLLLLPLILPTPLCCHPEPGSALNQSGSARSRLSDCHSVHGTSFPFFPNREDVTLNRL
jgi:hypothetical protein